MRIFTISTNVTNNSKGGLERFVYELSRVRNSDINFLKLDNKKQHWLKVSIKTFFYLLKNSSKYDLIESHYVHHAIGLIFYKPIKLSVFFHSPWAEEAKAAGDSSIIRYKVRKIIEIKYLNRADYIFTVGTSMKTFLISEYDLEETKIRIIGAGVNSKRFFSNPETKREKVIICVRRLEPRMGIEELINAWSNLIDHSGYKMHIIGRGSLENSIRKLITDKNLDDTVKVLGHLTDDALLHQYQLAKISVVPSKSLEGFGLIVLESLACGTPVISTRTGELHFIVENKWANLTYESGKIQQLSNLLYSVINNSIKLPSSDECINYAQMFNWDSINRRLLSYYSE